MCTSLRGLSPSLIRLESKSGQGERGFPCQLVLSSSPDERRMPPARPIRDSKSQAASAFSESLVRSQVLWHVPSKKALTLKAKPEDMSTATNRRLCVCLMRSRSHFADSKTPPQRSSTQLVSTRHARNSSCVACGGERSCAMLNVTSTSPRWAKCAASH